MLTRFSSPRFRARLMVDVPQGALLVGKTWRQGHDSADRLGDAGFARAI
jgi:hypothetical protein